MTESTKTEWEVAARAAGLTLVDELVCAECSGEGAVLTSRGRIGTCPACGGEYRPSCPMSAEEYAPGEMAWVIVRGYRGPVSASAVIGCDYCGEHPKLPGEDCCAECLQGAPTRRGVEL